MRLYGTNPNLIQIHNFGIKNNASDGKVLASPKKQLVNGMNGYIHNGTVGSHKNSSVNSMQHHTQYHHNHTNGHHGTILQKNNGALGLHGAASSNGEVASPGSRACSKTSATASPINPNRHTGLSKLKTHQQHDLPPILRQEKSGDSNRDLVLNQFKETVFMLTWNPDHFDALVPFLVGALNAGKIQSDTSFALANILVQWVSSW